MFRDSSGAFLQQSVLMFSDFWSYYDTVQGQKLDLVILPTRWVPPNSADFVITPI